jgi:hypothetical protein
MSAETKAHRRPPAHHRLRPVIALLAIVLAALVLAACGGSSSSGSGTTNSADGTTNSANTTTQGGSRSNRFASVRACLQKEGINLPAGGAGRPAGGGPPSGGPGHFKLPEGVSRSKFQEAMKKCGGGFFRRGRPSFNNATTRAALTKYAECMRANGVNLPAPNTNGKGPVFNTKGINTSSATFKAARTKCQSDLKGAFGAGRPAGGGPPGGGSPGGVPGGGAPPAGGEGGPPQGGYGPPPGSGAEGG